MRTSKQVRIVVRPRNDQADAEHFLEEKRKQNKFEQGRVRDTLSRAEDCNLISPIILTRLHDFIFKSLSILSLLVIGEKIPHAFLGM